MRKLKTLLIFLLSFSCIQWAGAQAGEEPVKKSLLQPDERIAKALDRLGMKYSMSESGNFKLTMNAAEGRTHLVTIVNQTETYESMEIREVQGVAFSSQYKSDYSSAMLFGILEENHQKKLGSWQINGGEPPYLLLFSVRISANSSDKILQEVIDLVATLADKKEKAITGGKDVF